MKITKFYLNRASYVAFNESGEKFIVSVDYWNNRLSISKSNLELENYARKLLKNKHRVNFVYKMIAHKTGSSEGVR